MEERVEERVANMEEKEAVLRKEMKAEMEEQLRKKEEEMEAKLEDRVLSERQKKNRSKFWTLKNRYCPILFLCFSSFLSYNFFQQILFAKKNYSNT